MNRKKAAALKYENGYDEPIVTAKGIGIIADKIVQNADENKVPIVYNKELTDLLLNIDVGDSVPPELYEMVAEILAYIMEVDGELNKRR